ncbi:2OG-Fe(II) oxygenase [Pelagibius sp.]|uniref:2OG-Fe(II) oxygenase n=1 Tax=Pelagibius sp. TaxID=1931238 RepID=UPI0026081C45|nr:2OG-Fe(II) oxygenase [Pelagibius sp.]
MLNFESIKFDYDPYPIGLARGALDADLYRELIDTFPDDQTFVLKEFNGVKYSLSRHNNKAGYFDHLRKNEAWGRFYDYIASESFIVDTMTMLKAHNIDLGLANVSWQQRALKRFKALKKRSPQPHIPRLRSRFEFSSMPVTGGNIRPHTDHPSKVVTMVIPILREDEWKEEYGGGTSVVWPKDRARSYNFVNGYMDFDEVDCVRTYPFEPNQCLVFVKTYNSWHAVWPMTGNDSKVLRRTLTINIEAN